MGSTPIEGQFHAEVVAVMNALVSGDLAAVADRLEPALELFHIEEALYEGRYGGELLMPVTAEHLHQGFQIREGEFVEVYVPFATATGQADLELRMSGDADAPLLIMDVLHT